MFSFSVPFCIGKFASSSFNPLRVSNLVILWQLHRICHSYTAQLLAGFIGSDSKMQKSHKKIYCKKSHHEQIPDAARHKMESLFKIHSSFKLRASFFHQHSAMDYSYTNYSCMIMESSLLSFPELVILIKLGNSLKFFV